MAGLSSRERLATAWSFQEPDRVPIELEFSGSMDDVPAAQRIRDFVSNEADNFKVTAAADWGFFSLDTRSDETIIEEVPGGFTLRTTGEKDHDAG